MASATLMNRLAKRVNRIGSGPFEAGFDALSSFDMVENVDMVVREINCTDGDIVINPEQFRSCSDGSASDSLSEFKADGT